MNLGGFHKKVEEAIAELNRENDDTGSLICTGYIVVSEWVDFTGAKYIQTNMSEEIAPWTAVGMLSYAIENDIYDVEEADD